MKLMETGEFLVDVEAMGRKKQEDLVKLWRHRAGVIWRIVLAPVLKPIAFVTLIVCYIAIWVASIIFLMRMGLSDNALGTVIFFIILVHVLGIAFWDDTMDAWRAFVGACNNKKKEIKDSWNP